jgi:phosphotransferase system HPr (HPr) family protein
MKSAEVTILNPSGLHARPAASFAALAGKYDTNIRIRNLTNVSNYVNAKSMLMVLPLGLSGGMRAEIEAAGPEEEEAVRALTAFLLSGCGEAV